jgi:hypothetical protein
MNQDFSSDDDIQSLTKEQIKRKNLELRRINSEYDTMKRGIESLKRQIERQNRIKDPVIRYSVGVELVTTIFDLVLSIGTGTMEDNTSNKLSEISHLLTVEESTAITQKHDKIVDEMNIFRTKIEEYFENLREWVAQPVYSPAHPFGNSLMKSDLNKYDGSGGSGGSGDSGGGGGGVDDRDD